jgi:hypothetical protein
MNKKNVNKISIIFKIINYSQKVLYITFYGMSINEKQEKIF